MGNLWLMEWETYYSVLLTSLISRKDSGFKHEKKEKLIKCTMDDKVFFTFPHYFPGLQVNLSIDAPCKPKFANFYILNAMSPGSAHNIYLTGDFRRFHKLTSFEPQQQYRWYRPG